MRYSGKLGLAQQSEVRPGIWEETVTEKPILGKVEQRTEALAGSSSVIPEYRTTTSISVLSRGPDQLNNADIRYVVYMGVRWTVVSMVYEYPHLVLYIGEKYNGPIPE